MFTEPNHNGVPRAVKWTWSQYQDYLESDEWIRLRNDAFRVWKKRCHICGTSKRLQIHHLCYGEFPEDSTIEDLMPLCGPCHKKVHSVFKVPMVRKEVLTRFRGITTRREVPLAEQVRRLANHRKHGTRSQRISYAEFLAEKWRAVR
jgi:hypothetical protein